MNNLKLSSIYNKALHSQSLTIEECMLLFSKTPLGELMAMAQELRQEKVPGESVTWMIDRNVNITNICISNCRFCNFHCKPNDVKAYITSIDEYKQKIDEMYSLGGRQLLLQGGLHPKLGIDFYETLFKELKHLYPDIKLHALGPAEIVHISKLEGLNYATVIERLLNSGLDSLPGAGAEILSDRVRHKLSPAKCTTSEWLDVMRQAHKLNMITSATMMFGHIETLEERMEHLVKIRDLQNEKPAGSPGFLAFIPWPFQDDGTWLKEHLQVQNEVNAEEYIRMIAISRIVLYNVQNIQASWLTVGKEIAQVCLHSGANDFGSIMIEENVVSAAGAHNSFNTEGIKKAIVEAGFIPRQRNQKYELLD
jgi:cyclic dehypoxanthinyl futalosine synthase